MPGHGRGTAPARAATPTTTTRADPPARKKNNQKNSNDNNNNNNRAPRRLSDFKLAQHCGVVATNTTDPDTAKNEDRILALVSLKNAYAWCHEVLRNVNIDKLDALVNVYNPSFACVHEPFRDDVIFALNVFKTLRGVTIPQIHAMYARTHAAAAKKGGVSVLFSNASGEYVHVADSLALRSLFARGQLFLKKYNVQQMIIHAMDAKDRSNGIQDILDACRVSAVSLGGASCGFDMRNLVVIELIVDTKVEAKGEVPDVYFVITFRLVGQDKGGSIMGYDGPHVVCFKLQGDRGKLTVVDMDSEGLRSRQMTAATQLYP
jgi:hypothetical protein